MLTRPYKLLGQTWVLVDPFHFNFLYHLIVTADHDVNIFLWFALLVNNIVKPMRFELERVNNFTNLSSCNVPEEWKRIQKLLLFEHRFLLLPFQNLLKVLLVKGRKINRTQAFNRGRPRRPIKQRQLSKTIPSLETEWVYKPFLFLVSLECVQIIQLSLTEIHIGLWVEAMDMFDAWVSLAI